MSRRTEIADGKVDMNTTTGARATTDADTVSAHADAEVSSRRESPRGVPRLGLIFVVALLIAIGCGVYLRRTRETTLARMTSEASVLSVSVVHPTSGSQSDDLILPGNVQAFTETPVYSRTNGYLRKWYFDIGARVRKGQLLAEIETPEIDQQLNQSRAELERMQANEQLAEVTSNRWQALLAKHAVSQQEADQAKSNYIAEQDSCRCEPGQCAPSRAAAELRTHRCSVRWNHNRS